jgi:Xaa-Pro aminopeptidase
VNTAPASASGMEKGGLALFHSNDIMPTSADGTMPFKQATDIMYLTGIDQEESVLLLFPDTMDPKDREILFVRETNEHIAIWEGHKFSKEEATELSADRQRAMDQQPMKPR